MRTVNTLYLPLYVIYMQIRSRFENIKKLYREYHYEHLVVRVFLNWVRGKKIDGVVEFRLKTIDARFQIKNGRINKRYTKHGQPRFFVCTPAIQHDRFKEKDTYAALYTSPLLHIYEYIKNERRVIRHGLSDSDKRKALSLARKSLEYFLLHKKRLPLEEGTMNLDGLFTEPALVDVVLWVSGTVRGSIIYRGESLTHALVEGVIRSARDPRFEPLTYDELEKLTIEVNIFTDLYIPAPNPRLYNSILENKGYRVRHRDQMGWFLPSVFNMTLFPNYSNFLKTLATQKGRISEENLTRSRFETFEVSICIEGDDTKKMHTLHGSILESKVEKKLTTQGIKEKADSMADWICRIQSETGFLPRRANPYTQLLEGTDWPRMAFSSFALGMYGRCTKSKKYTQAARKAGHYIHSIIDEVTYMPDDIYLLTHAYLGRLFLIEGNVDLCHTYIEKIYAKSFNKATSVITRLQIASLLFEAGESNKSYLEHSKKITKDIYTQWEELVQKKEEISLAEYAELVPLLFYYTHTIKDSFFSEKEYANIMNWYSSQQNTNGSFSNTTISPYTYTRGTGKIFEALAIDSTLADVNKKTLAWLLQFQYTEESFFAVKPEFQKKLEGSIMHDHFNHTSWIDSAGHILIGISRLENHVSL